MKKNDASKKDDKTGARVALDSELVADLEVADTTSIQGGGRGQPTSNRFGVG